MSSPNPYEYEVPVDELIRRYRVLYSGAVYDVLDGMGLPYQALANDLMPVTVDMVIAGPAFPLKGFSDNVGNEQLRERRIHMFKEMARIGKPLIDVRDCSFDTQVAHYGEMNAVVGKASGVIGAVVDGGIRDTAFLLREKFPVFSRYRTPVEAFKRWSYLEWNTTVGLRGALNAIVPVSPGDFVFGDLDGVVIVPRELTVEVLVKAEALIDTEDNARLDFSTGDPAEVYARYGKL